MTFVNDIEMQDPKHRPKFSWWHEKLTLEVLESHFHQPLREVAEQYGLCVTFLKRVCRARGIDRWPVRKVAQIQKRQKRMGETVPQQVTSQVIASFKEEEALRLKKRVTKVKAQRVPVWDREKKRKLAGMAAPLERNLAQYLREHPTCEVYDNQDLAITGRKRTRSDAGVPSAPVKLMRFDGTYSPASSMENSSLSPSPSMASSMASSPLLTSCAAPAPPALTLGTEAAWPCLRPAPVNYTTIVTDPKMQQSTWAHEASLALERARLNTVPAATYNMAPTVVPTVPTSVADAAALGLGDIDVMSVLGTDGSYCLPELEEACLNIVATNTPRAEPVVPMLQTTAPAGVPLLAPQQAFPLITSSPMDGMACNMVPDEVVLPASDDIHMAAAAAMCPPLNTNDQVLCEGVASFMAPMKARVSDPLDDDFVPEASKQRQPNDDLCVDEINIDIDEAWAVCNPVLG